MAELKRHMIELVKDVKEGEIVTEKYLTPMFIPMKVVYEAIDLAGEIETFTGGPKEEKELIEKMLAFIADKVYGGQFTKKELFEGLHAPDSMRLLQEQILFIARGMQNSDTKKYFRERKS